MDTEGSSAEESAILDIVLGEKMRGQRGFTLVQALVAISIAAVATLSIADMVRYMNLNLARVERKGDLYDAKRELEQVLSANRKVPVFGSTTEKNSLCNCILDPIKNTTMANSLRFGKGGELY